MYYFRGYWTADYIGGAFTLVSGYSLPVLRSITYNNNFRIENKETIAVIISNFYDIYTEVVANTSSEDDSTNVPSDSSPDPSPAEHRKTAHDLVRSAKYNQVKKIVRPTVGFEIPLNFTFLSSCLS